MFIPFFTSFFTYFSHNLQWTIFATLSCLLFYSFCANFLHWLTVFSCRTSYKVMIGLFCLSFASHILFELSVLAWQTARFPFQISYQLFSASSTFLFHLLFLAFLLQTGHTFFCFSIVPSFHSSSSVWITYYPLHRYILLFLQLSHLQSMAQLNSWHTMRSCFLLSLHFSLIFLLRHTLSTSLLDAMDCHKLSGASVSVF